MRDSRDDLQEQYRQELRELAERLERQVKDAEALIQTTRMHLEQVRGHLAQLDSKEEA
jgi:exonuclease VII small subunit